MRRKGSRRKAFVYGCLSLLALLILLLLLSRSNNSTVDAALRRFTPTPQTAAAEGGGGNSRIVAVGDLHGDYLQALRVLRMAQVACGAPEDPPPQYPAQATWCGGANTALVLLGDLVDRGTHSRAVVALVSALKRSAPRSDCVRMCYGNHEFLAAHGDVRYAAREDVEDFGGAEAREKAFSIRGPEGAFIHATAEAIVVVGNTVFVHGGLSPKIASFGVEAVNARVRTAFANPHGAVADALGKALFDRGGPLWNRDLAMGTPERACKDVASVLRILGAQRMVVGHTVQRQGLPVSRCNGKLFLVDVGISSVFGGGHAAVLELSDGMACAVLTPQGRQGPIVAN